MHDLGAATGIFFCGVSLLLITWLTILLPDHTRIDTQTANLPLQLDYGSPKSLAALARATGTFISWIAAHSHAIGLRVVHNF